MTSPSDALPFPVPLPGDHPAEVAVAAPGDGPGHWAGAPSAAVGPDGEVWLAYRLRRPVGDAIVRLQRFIANSQRRLRARFRDGQ